jgi:micrococcal nuclease
MAKRGLSFGTAKLFLAAAAVGGLGGYALSGGSDPNASETRRPSSEVFYRYCDEARAAGVAPLYRGDPGYRSALDADGDGVACEPYYGR